MIIKFFKSIFNRLEKALVWDGKEKAAFLLCHRSSSKDNVSLLVHDIMIPKEDDYEFRSAGRCIVKKSFTNIVYNGGVEGQYDVIKVHTHPPSHPAIYSPVDEQNEPEFLRHVASKIDGMHLASLVFSCSFDSLDGWYYDPEKDALLPIEKVTIIGKDGLEIFIPYRSPLKDKTLGPALNRTALAFGEGRVKKFRCLDIGIIGTGGTGSALIELVARDQPKKILICDPDDIEVSNLNRLVGATEDDIGKNKAEFYAEYVKRISPNTEVIAFPNSFYDPDVQKEYSRCDIIIGCVDSGARLAINQLCSAHMIPYFDIGASIQSTDGSPEFIGGQIYSVIPGREVCLSCSGVFDRFLHEYLSPMARQANIDQGYVKGDDGIKSPLVASLDFAIASIGYFEALKYALGIPGQKSFKVYLDQINDKIVRSDCKPEKCIVCREDGYLGKGDKAPFLYPQDDIDDERLFSTLERCMS